VLLKEDTKSGQRQRVITDYFDLKKVCDFIERNDFSWIFLIYHDKVFSTLRVQFFAGTKFCEKWPNRKNRFCKKIKAANRKIKSRKYFYPSGRQKNTISRYN